MTTRQKLNLARRYWPDLPQDATRTLLDLRERCLYVDVKADGDPQTYRSFRPRYDRYDTDEQNHAEHREQHPGTEERREGRQHVACGVRGRVAALDHVLRIRGCQSPSRQARWNVTARRHGQGTPAPQGFSRSPRSTKATSADRGTSDSPPPDRTWERPPHSARPGTGPRYTPGTPRIRVAALRSAGSQDLET
jgi:hypothetical protein